MLGSRGWDEQARCIAKRRVRQRDFRPAHLARFAQRDRRTPAAQAAEHLSILHGPRICPGCVCRTLQQLAWLVLGRSDDLQKTFCGQISILLSSACNATNLCDIISYIIEYIIKVWAIQVVQRVIE